jgi:hypothetical protein
MVPPYNDRMGSCEGFGGAAIRATTWRFAVCVENSVPVASAQWHVQVWVKVSVR